MCTKLVASPGQQLGHKPSKMFVGPVLGRKLSMNVSVNGHQINGQPVWPICFGAALDGILI